MLLPVMAVKHSLEGILLAGNCFTAWIWKIGNLGTGTSAVTAFAQDLTRFTDYQIQLFGSVAIRCCCDGRRSERRSPSVCAKPYSCILLPHSLPCVVVEARRNFDSTPD
jgi:hypothetical protein